MLHVCCVRVGATSERHNMVRPGWFVLRLASGVLLWRRFLVLWFTLNWPWYRFSPCRNMKPPYTTACDRLEFLRKAEEWVLLALGFRVSIATLFSSIFVLDSDILHSRTSHVLLYSNLSRTACCLEAIAFEKLRRKIARKPLAGMEGKQA